MATKPKPMKPDAPVNPDAPAMPFKPKPNPQLNLGNK